MSKIVSMTRFSWLRDQVVAGSVAIELLNLKLDASKEEMFAFIMRKTMGSVNPKDVKKFVNSLFDINDA